MDRRLTALAWLSISVMAGCSTLDISAPEHVTVAPIESNPMLGDMLDCLASQEQQSLSQRQQQLQTRLVSSLQLPAQEQFQLACLLGHTQASNEELRQAQQILVGLRTNAEFATDEHQALISIYQRKLELMLALRQQVRETREYRDKIEQLKGLEEELEIEVPLPPDLSEVSR
ncbi:hypothetical protein [Marinobacterium lutimaris]|uniref:YfhG lipoprotein n=1 Tax=Marinobacterium lutimaris TaxID=568106 RepID=A0A1H6AN90_9GAMM|nr:hypothetical protein [Marinobacterium lutimaris]SEG50189.1 hypothetical protein SAMN05444390_102121 [Marinobacterium lutimaris]